VRLILSTEGNDLRILKKSIDLSGRRFDMRELLKRFRKEDCSKVMEHIAKQGELYRSTIVSLCLSLLNL
jgi:hypothetical protein